MSIAAIPLNHYLNEAPFQRASSLHWKKNFWSLVEKICCVALVVIPIAILTAFYGNAVLTGSLSLVMMGVSLLSIGAASVIMNFKEWSNTFGKLSKIEEKVQSEYEVIQEWKTPEIEQFLQEQRIDAHQIPSEAIEALQQKNRQEPLCALLPLIARFKYLKQSAEKTERAVNETLNHQFQNRFDTLLNWNIAWQKLEEEAIPTALNAAVLLHILQNPICELTREDLGDLDIRPYEHRSLLREFGRNDDYFIFKDDLRRSPLTLAEIKQNLDPRELHAKLFARPSQGNSSSIS